MKKITILCLMALLDCWFVRMRKSRRNKPIDQVKTEAEKMDASQLRSMAESYKQAILAKKPEIDKMMEKLKQIPVDKIMSDEAKGIREQMDTLNKSIAALKERLNIYINKLKEKGGDISGA